MGVFTTMDPIGYVDGSNLYSYLNNAPITNTDSLGFAANVPLTDPTITSISIDDLNDSDSASYFAANFITSKNWGRTQELGNWNDENGIITFTGKIITSQIRLTVHCCSDQALLEAIDAFYRAPVLKEYFGKQFVDTFCTLKEVEADRFFSEPTLRDYEWYLRTV